MQDLMNELQAVREELRKSMKMLRQNGNAMAQAENAYHKAKADKWVLMESEGCPITKIKETIKGQPEVAEAMLKRDLARVMYESNQEHINVVKLDLRVIESQIAREWSSEAQNV